MKILVVASRNRGKLAEIERIFGLDSNLSRELLIKSVSEFNLPDVEETGETFEANAILKAETISRATGLPALADDSGLSVDALGGAPGVYSARFAGRHGDDAANIEKLLLAMKDLPDIERTAKFVAAIAVVKPDGSALTARGELRGSISLARTGDFGFGYDPIFKPEGSDRTLGEFTPVEKDAISHRAIALRQIAPKISVFLAGS